MENQPKCLFCEKTSHEAPLVNLTYQEQSLWICSQHLPILIHEPEKLTDHLAAALKKKS